MYQYQCTVGQRVVTTNIFVGQGHPKPEGAGYKGVVTDTSYSDGVYYVRFDDEKLGTQFVFEFEITPEVDIREWHRLTFWEANAMQIARENSYVVGNSAPIDNRDVDEVSSKITARLVELGLLVAEGGSDGYRQTHLLTPKGKSLTDKAFQIWLKVGVRVTHIPTGKLATVTALTDAGINALADDGTIFTLEGGGVFTPAYAVSEADLTAEPADDSDEVDPRVELALRYNDDRIAANERGVSFPEYKTWLENQVLKLQKMRATELRMLETIQELASDAQGEWLPVDKLYAPNWTGGYKDILDSVASLGTIPKQGNVSHVSMPDTDDLPF